MEVFTSQLRMLFFIYFLQTHYIYNYIKLHSACQTFCVCVSVARTYNRRLLIISRVTKNRRGTIILQIVFIRDLTHLSSSSTWTMIYREPKPKYSWKMKSFKYLYLNTNFRFFFRVCVCLFQFYTDSKFIWMWFWFLIKYLFVLDSFSL